jgi:segregation and condensation protein B
MRLPEEDQPAPAHELARDAETALVEAALFAADEPLPLRRLAQATGLEQPVARDALHRLCQLLEREGSAFLVDEIAGGWQLRTGPEYHPWVARLRRGAAEASLTPAARETLAVIAYRQPITRADIEGVRGVGCAEVLRQLMERGLVRLAGRDDSLGRPALYETTRKFLQVFGLRSLADLPPADQARPGG